MLDPNATLLSHTLLYLNASKFNPQFSLPSLIYGKRSKKKQAKRQLEKKAILQIQRSTIGRNIYTIEIQYLTSKQAKGKIWSGISENR